MRKQEGGQNVKTGREYERQAAAPSVYYAPSQFLSRLSTAQCVSRGGGSALQPLTTWTAIVSIVHLAHINRGPVGDAELTFV